MQDDFLYPNDILNAQIPFTSFPIFTTSRSYKWNWYLHWLSRFAMTKQSRTFTCTGHPSQSSTPCSIVTTGKGDSAFSSDADLFANWWKIHGRWRWSLPMWMLHISLHFILLKVCSILLTCMILSIRAFSNCKASCICGMDARSR